MPENIHPVFDRMLSRKEREERLGQQSCVVWFTGLSGSGKSTIAIALEHRLFSSGYFAQMLDGDNIRFGLNANLGFSLEDRAENIRRIAEVAKLFKNSGLICLCSFISPTRAMRDQVSQIVGSDDFLEIYVDTPLEICEARDVKGLYAKARAGQIKGFTGIDSPYEPPEDPFLRITTEGREVDECVDLIMKSLIDRINPNTPNV
ncbi:MAG: adenylyl-sulfate kinase [Bacteroidota bacterium]